MFYCGVSRLNSLVRPGDNCLHSRCNYPYRGSHHPRCRWQGPMKYLRCCQNDLKFKHAIIVFTSSDVGTPTLSFSTRVSAGFLRVRCKQGRWSSCSTICDCANICLNTSFYALLHRVQEGQFVTIRSVHSHNSRYLNDTPNYSSVGGISRSRAQMPFLSDFLDKG